ncbi:MAG: methanogenesis marker 6 protein [Methanomassiliicoccales archaeon]
MAKEDWETRMIVISPSSSITPDQITRTVHSLGLNITVKETCYGAMIEGKKDDVRKALKSIRNLDPDRIFTKIRGFPIGDTRRCRAHHGSRPGFTQLEKEWECLRLIEKGISASARGEPICEPNQVKKLPIKKLREIIDEVSK